MTESQYGVKTKIIDVDFTNGVEIYDRIRKEIEGLEIGVLINNVGMSYTYPEYLAQVNLSKNFPRNNWKGSLSTPMFMSLRLREPILKMEISPPQE